MTISPVRFGRHFRGYLISARHLFLVLLAAFTVLWLVLWYAEGSQPIITDHQPRGPWDSLYLAAISALTIGFGDFSPATVLGRVVVIALGLLGVIFTGIVVAAAIAALPESEVSRD